MPEAGRRILQYGCVLERAHEEDEEAPGRRGFPKGVATLEGFRP